MMRNFHLKNITSHFIPVSSSKKIGLFGALGLFCLTGSFLTLPVYHGDVLKGNKHTPSHFASLKQAEVP